MATREKKVSVVRKANTTSPVPPKEDVVPLAETSEEPTIPINDEPVEHTSPTLVKNPASRNAVTQLLTHKTTVKRLKKKPAITIGKPKLKKKPTPKPKLMKSLLLKPKNQDTKKTLLKQVKPRKPRITKSEELPPVLEPILPIGEEADNKTPKKKSPRPPKIDNYAKKAEINESEGLVVDQTKAKRVYRRKAKSEPANETVDDVMNELTTLIKDTDVKEDADVEIIPILESPKSNTPKVKRVVKRRKKLNIENTLSKLSASQRKVIDMLDLNVAKFKGLPAAKRRHSIEKFPIGNLDNVVPTLTQSTIFNTLPRSLSPRSKTTRKLRISIEGLGRRSNPYKTRSDSPARILRNGKHRKLKDLELLEGLDVNTYKRRRRHCSDFSGSELSVSKFSGYESDSSFSDMSSLHGESRDLEATIKSECKENFDNGQFPSGQIKRSFSTEAELPENNFTDTNSNLCLNDPDKVIKDEPMSTSLKVPEKTLILDNMKQAFNEEEKKEEVEVIPEQAEAPSLVEEPKTPSLNGSNHEAEELTNGHSSNAIQESPEDLAIKENILQALGLQSLKAAKEARLKTKERSEIRPDPYTGTLKTVIKLNRADKKKGRNSMKMTLHKNRGKTGDVNGVEEANKSAKDGPSTSWKHGGQSSDTAGAHRKTHYSNRSNMDGSSEHTSDGEPPQEGPTKALVIPEKASSFSIHPGRVCKDECSYCFGKFGLFDTPCHIAQMKNVERQNKILSAEKHLTCDSCLCDACYRHVDRKANTPSYTNKSYKRSVLVAPGPRQDHCHVLGCGEPASNILRRKWIIKMRKSICEVINIDLDNPGLHSIPICDEHFSALEHLMVCAMCKRRLARNHVHYLGPETLDLNTAMNAEGIPLSLNDKPVVCKLCKYFAAIILKAVEERPENSMTFFNEYKKRLLHFNDIVPMDEASAEEPIIIPSKEKSDREPTKKKRKMKASQEVPSEVNVSRSESPSDYMVDYNTLIPSIAMECGSDSESKKEPAPVPRQKIAHPDSVKQAVEISKKLKNDKSSDIAVQRLGSNPSISVRQLFPCEEDLPLQGQVEFGNVKERTPEGWEKCTSVIQYDMETKHLWQELQKPYGNQSSFLRHLILLEKYFRNGDLVLAPNASHHSVNYSESVHNRLRAYDNIPSSIGNVQPITMIPFNKPQKSSSGIVTSANNSTTVKETKAVVTPIINTANIPKSTPLTIAQLQSPPLIPPPPVKATKTVGAPPGLISLHPGTSRPVAPLVKTPQSQKIKFPITKNWRPNLIPIDPTKKSAERKAGLVQVISGGKPYHITLEDYKKMCAIKKSFELKQKRLQEASKGQKAGTSVLKSMVPRKGLVIAKTPVKSEEPENILEKLDKQVEKLGGSFGESVKPPLALPKIPKSLTVIPQTVARKPSRPASPELLITPKPKQIIKS